MTLSNGEKCAGMRRKATGKRAKSIVESLTLTPNYATPNISCFWQPTYPQDFHFSYITRSNVDITNPSTSPASTICPYQIKLPDNAAYNPTIEDDFQPNIRNINSPA